MSGPNGYFSYQRDTLISNLQPINSGTYVATYYNTNGCNTVQNFTITVNAAPTVAITAGGPTTFCSGGSVALTATAGYTYVWSATAGSATTQAVTAITGGTYTVTATSSGCSASASTTVTVNTASTITPYLSVNGGAWANTATATLCQGGYVEFGPQPYGTWTVTGPNGYFSYQRDTTITNLLPVNSGTYVATYYNTNGCNSTQNFSITVNPAPTLSVNSPTTCGGIDTLIATTSGISYAWSTGASTSFITTTSSSTYRVTVTGANTCTASATGTATNNAIPTSSVTVTPVCAGGASTLAASGGNTYLWSTGASTVAITSTTATAYTVTATSSAGCTAVASGTAVIYPAPALATTSNSPACLGSTATMSVTASGSTSYTYSWTGPSFTSTSSSVSITNATSANTGSYTVTVRDNNTCASTATIPMFIDPNCADSTTVGVNGGNSSDAPCTQILRFDHYNDVTASAAGGQNHKWILKNGNVLTMTVTRTAGSFTSVAAPTWSGAAFGQSGYSGLTGKTVLYTAASGYSKVVFSNIVMKDSLGTTINNFTLIGIDGESTDGAERDTLVSNGTTWFDYDTITPPSIGSVPSETGIATSTLVWTGTGPVNARARLVSTNAPTNFSFSTVAGGLQGFAMGVSNPVQAPSTLTICSKSSFNATPTNLPVGTTYTWSAPVVTPAGSLTGATAQATGLAIAGQTLTNTTTSPATAVYSILPSNNCSGLGYTVTVTVQGSFSAIVTPSTPQCAGSSMTGLATPTVAGTYGYSWSGPLSFTATGASWTIATSTLANSGTYTVTMTAANSCTATASGVVSVVTCVTVAGAIFDDANGNGVKDATDTATSRGQVLYGVMTDTSGLVLATSTISAAGAFSFLNILPNTGGLHVYVSTTLPAIGVLGGSYSWPSRWVGTLGQYGLNNLRGTGVFGGGGMVVPVKTATSNISGILLGYDQLPTSAVRSYIIPYPAHNSQRMLTRSNALGLIAGTDPEDGTIGAGKKFVITDITGMNGNSLYYDANGDGVLASYERITGYSTITSFDSTKLYVKFTGPGSTSAVFNYATMDAAGQSDPAPSTYTIRWSGALPVKLISFDGVRLGSSAAKLTWATASEINNDHFDIERSADASVWQKIGEVKGAGNSNERIDYTMTDDAPLPGANYYRLMQVDIDGQSEYSNVIEVSFGIAHRGTVMTTYPNPLAGGKALSIVLAGSDEVIRHVMISNEMGQIVYESDAGDTQGYQVQGLDLAAGIYIVNVVSQSYERYTSKLIIQH